MADSSMKESGVTALTVFPGRPDGTSRFAEENEAMAGVALHVAVVGPTLRKGNLAPHLPTHWTVTHHRQLEVGDPDLLVLLAPSDAKVRDARRRRPDTVILVVLSLLDPPESVVEVLDAGADSCVRTDAAGIVATHVLACRRRQLAPLRSILLTPHGGSRFAPLRGSRFAPLGTAPLATMV